MTSDTTLKELLRMAHESLDSKDAKIADLEKELDKDNFAVVPRSLSRDMRIAYHESIERHEDCQEDLGCPDDQWTAMLEAHEALKEQE
jgi:hypothetical protein